MAKCDVSIEFDRADRAYRSGEEVTGSVVIQAHQDVRCNELAIEHFWQTHGRGNKDTGERARTVLFEGEWRSGETARFPFRFIAPPGPATHRGNYLNIDHYVAARVDVPWAFDPKCQEEFLLTPTAPDYFAGTQAEHHDVAKATEQFKKFAVPGAVVLIVIGVLCIFPFGIIMIPAGLYLLFIGLRNQFAEKRLGQVGFQLARTEVVPGEQVPVRLSIRPQKTTEHNGITAKLTGVEKATSGSGTNSTTYTHKLCEETITLCEAGTVTPGAPLDLETSVAIPADAPYSFLASDNKILWQIELRIDIPRWPDWVYTQMLSVRPFSTTSPSPHAVSQTDAQLTGQDHVAEAPVVEAIPAEPIAPEPLATSDEQWQSPFDEPEPVEATAPIQASPPPAAPMPATPGPAEIAAPLLAALAQIAATDRFGGRRDAQVKQLAGQVFECPIQVDNVSHTFGYVEDRAFRDGRTVEGTVVESEQKVSLLIQADRNAELDRVQRGDRLQTRCRIVGWDDLYKRAELQEA